MFAFSFEQSLKAGGDVTTLLRHQKAFSAISLRGAARHLGADEHGSMLPADAKDSSNHRLFFPVTGKFKINLGTRQTGKGKKKPLVESERDHGSPGRTTPLANAGGKTAEICIGPDDAFAGEAASPPENRSPGGARFSQMLQQRLAFVPAHPRGPRSTTFVPPSSALIGMHWVFCDSELGWPRATKSSFNFKKNIFAIAGQGHLVHSGKHAV